MWFNTWRDERRTHDNRHLNGLINNFQLNRVQIERFSQMQEENAQGKIVAALKHLYSNNGLSFLPSYE